MIGNSRARSAPEAYGRVSRRRAPDCSLPAPARSSAWHAASGSAPEARVCSKTLCWQSTWWSHSALDMSCVRRLDERYSRGELEARVGRCREVWGLHPRPPEPRDSHAVAAPLCLVSKGLTGAQSARTQISVK